MPRASARRLSITDLALLVLVAAACVVVAHATDREFADIQYPFEARPWSRWPPWVVRGIKGAVRIQVVSQDCLTMICVGLAGITYRSSRLGPARPGPGQVAVLLATFLAVIAIVSRALFDWLDPLTPLMPGWGRSTYDGPPIVLYLFWTGLLPNVGWSVLAAWGTLAATGGWRRSRDWTEHLGRWLGWGWVFVLAYSEIIALVARS